jgi:paraquat-inducible protein A
MPDLWGNVAAPCANSRNLVFGGSVESGARDRSSVLNPRLIASAVACPDCDLLQRIPPLPPGGKARCLRCGCGLAKQSAVASDLPLALTLAAVIVFILANASPLMDLSVVGRTASTTIVGGAYQMWQEGEEITGVLVAFCAVIAPGGFLLFMLTLLLATQRFPAPFWVGEMLRWVNHFQIWSMLEVMLLGILVALIKIAELATVEPGIGMYAVGALVLLIPAILVSFNDRQLWQQVEWVDGEKPPPLPADGAVAGAAR